MNFVILNALDNLKLLVLCSIRNSTVLRLLDYFHLKMWPDKRLFINLFNKIWKCEAKLF